MGKTLVWDGQKPVEQKEAEQPLYVWDGSKPVLKKKAASEDGGNESGLNTSEPAIDYKNNFFTKNQFDEPEIELEDGVKLPVNKRAIPVTPYANPDDYVLDVQQRIKAGTKTPQDEKFIQNVRKSNRNFTPDDDISLSTISNKYSLPSEFPDVDSKITAVTQLKDMLLKKQMEEDTQYGGTGSGLGLQTVVRNAGKLKGDKLEEFERLTELQDKLKTEKQKTDTYPVYFDAAVRTDQSGNLLKKAMAGIALINPNTSAQGQIAISQQAVDHLEKLPVEFSMGLNGLKYTEPEQYKRVTKMLSNGEPLSETMVATITAQGLDAKEAIVKDGLVAGDLTPQQYKKETDKIQEVRYNNIVGNKETLRAFLSSGIANIADDIESEKSGLPHEEITKSIFGHTWNYSDAEIEQYGKTFAQANGIDPNDARVKEAIKYLQDNEGAMIMENSIAKTGAVRDLAKGLATPIRGVYNTVEGLTKTDAERYTEGQSQGNVNVSEQRLSRIKNNSVSDAVSDVLEGTGQFLTQAGMAAATSGLIGTAAKGLMASQLGATTAGELVGTAPKIGKMIMGSKDALSTVITSYAQSYDGNLKQAYTYTADDDKARATAGIMSGLEGATELFLSPLDIAKGIGNKLFNKKKLSKSVVDVLSDAAITDKSAAIKNILKSTLKGSLETGKVISAEIGEEEVTQIADYAANAILNPQSKTFQDRDLSAEIVNTAYQTGLSMVVPALASGAGAYKVNNFSKGSLLIAAQNRQQLIDDMKKRVHNGNMSQDEFNEKAEIINTAAKANDILPVKDNGKTLSTTEKANYVYSRVSEAILNKKLKVLEEDKSRSAGKIGEGEEATNVQDPEIVQLKKKIEAQVKYRTDILSLRPQYYVDNEPVSKQEFNDILKSEDIDKYDLSVENDNKTQESLREIGGKDEKIKDVTKVEQKEEKIKPVIVKEPENVLEGIEEEVKPKVSSLQENLNAARGIVAPVEEEKITVTEEEPVKEKITLTSEQQADKRAKELMGNKLVPSQPIELSTEVKEPSGVSSDVKSGEVVDTHEKAANKIQQLRSEQETEKNKLKSDLDEKLNAAKKRGFKEGEFDEIYSVYDKDFIKMLDKHSNELNKYKDLVGGDIFLMKGDKNAKEAHHFSSEGALETILDDNEIIGYEKSDEGYGGVSLTTDKKLDEKGIVLNYGNESNKNKTTNDQPIRIDFDISKLKEDGYKTKLGNENLGTFPNEQEIRIIKDNGDGIGSVSETTVSNVKKYINNVQINKELLGEEKTSALIEKLKENNIPYTIKGESENKPIQSEQAKEAEIPNTTTSESQSKEVVSEPAQQAEENEVVLLPPQIKGGIPRVMIFNEGEWKQKVGNEATKVSAAVQSLAQQRFEQDKKSMPEIEINKQDVALFNDIEKALSVAGKKNQQMEMERLYSGKNAKYTKEQVDAAIAINKNFDNIVKDMGKDNLLTKQCPT